jgi:hypothetical protein
MAMTASSSNFDYTPFTANSAPANAVPTSVPAGATVICAILNRTNETATVSSVVGSLNGAYTLAEGPSDSSAVTARVWTYYFLNSAAGSETITVTFDGAIDSHLVTGWCEDDAGAQTFDDAAITYNGTATAATPFSTSGLTVAGGGGMLVVGGSNNTNTFTDFGTDESLVSAVGSGQRLGVFFKSYTTAGSKTFTMTPGSSYAAVMQSVAFLTPGGGTTMTPAQGPLTLTGTGLGLGFTINMPDEL